MQGFALPPAPPAPVLPPPAQARPAVPTSVAVLRATRIATQQALAAVLIS